MRQTKAINTHRQRAEEVHDDKQRKEQKRKI